MKSIWDELERKTGIRLLPSDEPVTPVMRKKRRVAYCRCGEHLDSLFDETCPRCGWLICPTCGRCGCPDSD